MGDLYSIMVDKEESYLESAIPLLVKAKDPFL